MPDRSFNVHVLFALHRSSQRCTLRQNKRSESLAQTLRRAHTSREHLWRGRPADRHFSRALGRHCAAGGRHAEEVWLWVVDGVVCGKRVCVLEAQGAVHMGRPVGEGEREVDLGVVQLQAHGRVRRVRTVAVATMGDNMQRVLLCT